MDLDSSYRSRWLYRLALDAETESSLARGKNRRRGPFWTAAMGRGSRKRRCDSDRADAQADKDCKGSRDAQPLVTGIEPDPLAAVLPSIEHIQTPVHPGRVCLVDSA